MTQKYNYNILIAHINENAYSETFIHDTVKKLPFNNFEIYGGYFPYLLKIPKRVIITKRMRFFDNFLSSLLKKEINFFKNLLFINFLKKNNIKAILAEYGQVGATLMKVCKRTKIPLIVHFHGFDIWRKDILDKFLNKYKKLFINANKFIVGSKDMIPHLKNLGCEENKIAYIPCGVDTNFFQGANPGDAPPIFVSVGRFTYKKAQHLTILAFYLVLQKYPEAKLIMVGTGEELFHVSKEIVNSLGISKNIEFFGIKNPTEILHIFKKCRGYIQHSIQAYTGDSEGTGISILEAAASGLPVVSTRHAGIKLSVIHNKTGFLVNEHDVKSMASYIIKLIEDPKLAESMGIEGREHIKKKYTIERYINEIGVLIKYEIEK